MRNNTPACPLIAAILLVPLTGCMPDARSRALSFFGDPRHLIAQTYRSGFVQDHTTFNGLSAARDGRIYYVLCSARHDLGAQMFVLDPATGRIRHLGDLTEACGEKGRHTVVQGKSHVKFVEDRGKLYFATHMGYYTMVDGREKVGVPPAGFKPYPGGHLLAVDVADETFEDLAIAPGGEGIITMNMDPRRGRIFALTWPTGLFLRYDLAKRELKNLGGFFEEGENGQGPTYRTICRAIAVDPTDGSAYFTVPAGDILRYDPARDAVVPVVGDDLRKDYFGQYDPTTPGHMAYHWRQVVWVESERAIYGVHGNSGYLFRFDPRAVRVDVLDRITSEPSRLSGMFDQFSYGYLGFELGPDGRTLYYLTGAPRYQDGRRVTGRKTTAMGEAKGAEDFHLVTYDIPTRRYRDHGPIYTAAGARPAAINSIAVGNDGTVYTLAKFTEQGQTRVDLISIAPVLKR
ncbi:MAG: hypothetical protein AMXMBFR83_08800 [Phycisphaerae bacterium]